MRNIINKISQSLKEAGFNWLSGIALIILLLIVAGYAIYYTIGFVGMIYWATHSVALTIIACVIIIALWCAILFSNKESIW